MMDPYNLAICFGPTLLPIPPDRDQVAYQGSVNELIKNIIVHQEEIFPNDGGMVYEKFIVEDGEQEDTTDNMSEDGDTGDAASEEETEVMEASAQYDFQGRTDRELSFKKGDTLVVFNRVSTDWWEGAHQGKEGLIPDKYIVLKNRLSESS
jgi:SLIT-ROBO Rho GTPase activating protein